MNRLRVVILAGAAMSCVALAGVVTSAGSPAVPIVLRAQRDRTPAPDFTLTDATGATLRLSSYRGRVVLLDFWATWCTGCKVEIPWYIGFQKKYARRGLVSIGAAMDDEGWDKVAPYVKAHPIAYPIVLGNPVLAQPYKVTSLPLTILIDRNGNIADAHAGMVVKAVWEKEIRLLLAESRGAVPPARSRR